MIRISSHQSQSCQSTVRYGTVPYFRHPFRKETSCLSLPVRYHTYSSYIGYLLTYVMVRIFTSSHLWNIVLFFSCSLTCMTSNPLSLEIPTKILQYHCISNHAIIMLMRIILLWWFFNLAWSMFFHLKVVRNMLNLLFCII